MPRFTIPAGTTSPGDARLRHQPGVVLRRPGPGLGLPGARLQPVGVLPGPDLRPGHPPDADPRRRQGLLHHRGHADPGPGERQRRARPPGPPALAPGHHPRLHLQHRRQPHRRPVEGPQDRARRGGLRLAVRRRGRAERGQLRRRLEPAPAPPAARGAEGADPLADAVPEGPVPDPARDGPADAAVPLRRRPRADPGGAEAAAGRGTRRTPAHRPGGGPGGDQGPGQLLPGRRRGRVPLPGHPPARAQLPGRARLRAPRLPRAPAGR
jgi:hypothetical protein